MEFQAVINLAGGAALAAIGWFARQLWDAVSELRRDLHQIEVDLPRNYVPKNEFTDSMREIKSMLERVIERLEGKADR
jgi:hypothetical protein